MYGLVIGGEHNPRNLGGNSALRGREREEREREFFLSLGSWECNEVVRRYCNYIIIISSVNVIMLINISEVK